MYDLSGLEVRSGPARFMNSQREIDVPQLWAGAFRLGNDFEAIDWQSDPVQFEICGCRQPGCQGGGYHALRRAGDRVVLIPPFTRWDDAWAREEYASVPFPDDEIGGQLATSQWDAAIARQSASVPIASELEPLGYREAIAAWWLRAQVKLGTARQPLTFAVQRAAYAIAAGDARRFPEAFVDATHWLACEADGVDVVGETDRVLRSALAPETDGKAAEIAVSASGAPAVVYTDSPAAVPLTFLTIDSAVVFAMLRDDLGIRID